MEGFGILFAIACAATLIASFIYSERDSNKERFINEAKAAEERQHKQQLINIEPEYDDYNDDDNERNYEGAYYASDSFTQHVTIFAIIFVFALIFGLVAICCFLYSTAL